MLLATPAAQVTGVADARCDRLTQIRRHLDSRLVSKNPLRRLAEQITLATMRPPLTPRLLPRPGATKIDLAGKRVLLTGASSGIGESAAEQFARHGATGRAGPRRHALLHDPFGRVRKKVRICTPT